MKVVWICHFSNTEINGILKPWKQVNESAPWVSLSLKYLEGDKDIDLYVIAPHEYICGVHKFHLRGIHYIFFNPYIPVYGRHWPRFFRWDYMTDFAKSKRIVKRLVEEIKPDVIHLQGAENPYYSSTIFQFLNKYPTILTVQGFYYQSRGIKTGNNLKRMLIEKEILSKIPVCFYRTKKMAKDIITFNPNAKLCWGTYGSFEINPPDSLPNNKFDVVFFARVTKEKGIGDLLHAISIIKESRPSISLCVIGGGNADEFKCLAKDLRISDNVYWAGFLSTQEDVHSLALQAKISVLPTYFDIDPGTIMESMFLGIPVVSYATDSIPEINEKGEVISLVEKGNVIALANNINELLDDDALRQSYSEKAKIRAKEMFSFTDEQIKDSLLSGYRTAIQTFKKNV